MVLGTAPGGRRGSALLQPREVVETTVENVTEPSAEAARALHERLVAYVHAVAGAAPRGDVWVEHSYARARELPQARELLAPRPPPDGELDVCRLERAPSPLERALELEHEHEDDALDGDSDAPPDWETKVAALAPSSAHARLAAAAADILQRLRLARLAGGGSEATRAAARRLRLALAPLWVWPGPSQLRPAPWLNAALLAHLPRSLRRLYDDVLSQLRRTAPRLTERLMLGRLPPPASDPLGAVGPALGPDAAGPVLAWVSAGGADARWTRRLAALLHVRELRAAGGGAPDAWCAQAAAALRADLLEVIAEAGPRGVVVCGCGGGAALAAVVGGEARGVALLAPPLLTPEGGWPQRSLPARALLVVGTGAGGSGRGAAHAAAGRHRRLLLVAGADDALRLPYAHRARLKLPQHALDAAIVEEVYRWALEMSEAGSGSESSPAPSPERRRDSDTSEDASSLALVTPRSNRSIEIVEGRVVSRVSGHTPLALQPPAPQPPQPPQPPPRRRELEPSAADILHMPIVFADDASLAAPPPLTVTSGDARGSSGRITRVIVAKRGRASGAGALVLRRAD
ncbi:KAT8 regulatory NSL complex subunit 3-like isoform X2 [Plodia interpunctella]|uniref:KAT8 regulatory NSL complex subunit 3-like isoform X2 n=1 Tax=Plodia interpunctella TaxID=58824 RepID=UPI0023679BEF|nr:KAT8 regulatory NSL complex subunit 3-like isoform X2 [Plodia interpunctella]